VNGLVLRLTGPMQSRGERSEFTPRRGCRPVPRALRAAQRACHGAGHHPPAHRRTQLLRGSGVRRPGGPGPRGRLADYHTTGGGQLNNKRCHPRRPAKQTCSPCTALPSASPYTAAHTNDASSTTPGNALPAPDYRPNTLPTRLIDYAMKEATA
jgi:hypothetical protein